VWESGIDASFVVTALAAILFVMLMAWSCRLLRDRRRQF
jgi:hypothetical protein